MGRQHGLTTAQLFVIRDITTPLPPAQGILTPLQSAALSFVDASTRTVSVPTHVTELLRAELRKWVLKETSGLTEDEVKAKTDDSFVECALIVASYNMVSRFLRAVDVAGFSEDPVPWPLARVEVRLLFYTSSSQLLTGRSMSSLYLQNLRRMKFIPSL